MTLGILLSGGKDSVYAAYLAGKYSKISCAITIDSQNKESYMYHTPNIERVRLQCEAMNIPLIIVKTKGEKEVELKELEEAISIAIDKYHITSVVTGAVGSQYQASRVQRICHRLGIIAENPLWQKNQRELLNELIAKDFDVRIIGVFAYPFEKNWLGKKLNYEVNKKLFSYQDKFLINPAGEGGEIETFVCDCPLFSKKVVIDEFKTEYENYAGTYSIEEAHLEDNARNIENIYKNEISNNKSKENENYSNISENDLNDEIIVISTVKRKAHEVEFINPITDILFKNNLKYRVINIADVNKNIKNKKIIITGTSIDDNEFLRYKDNMKYIIGNGKNILGICAGMELILSYYNYELSNILEIGPKQLEIIDKKESISNMLKDKKGYFLHQMGIKNLKNDDIIKPIIKTDSGIAGIRVNNENIFGFQFHPEVSCKELILEVINK